MFIGTDYKRYRLYRYNGQGGNFGSMVRPRLCPLSRTGDRFKALLRYGAPFEIVYNLKPGSYDMKCPNY